MKKLVRYLYLLSFLSFTSFLSAQALAQVTCVDNGAGYDCSGSDSTGGVLTGRGAYEYLQAMTAASQQNGSGSGGSGTGSTTPTPTPPIDKKSQCKLDNAIHQKQFTDAAMANYRTSTIRCDDYLRSAGGASLGAALGGYAGAMAAAAAVALTIKGQSCQHEADSFRDDLLSDIQAAATKYDLTVCEQIQI